MRPTPNPPGEPTRPSRRTGHAARVAITFAVLASVGACADDGPASPTAGRAAERTTVQASDSTATGDGAIAPPAPQGAEPFAPETVDGNTTTQSFRVPDSTPQQAIEDYVALAAGDGWDTEVPPAPTGVTDWSATLLHGDSSLLVTSAPAQPDSPDAQLSIELTTG